MGEMLRLEFNWWHMTNTTRAYIQYIAERDRIAYNIAAVSGVPFDLIIKNEECVGMQATLERLQRVYEFVMGGGVLNYAPLCDE